MIITAWSDKGGTGKTTIATGLAHGLGLPLWDLDPQSDGVRYCQQAGIACRLLGDDYRDALKAKANSKDAIILDCPTAEAGKNARSMLGAALASLLILPTRSGAADLVGLGRGLALLGDVRKNGNPDLAVAVVLNGYRQTVRAQKVAEALAKNGDEKGYYYLGEVGLRSAIEEAYADGKPLLSVGGQAAHEMRKVVESIRFMLHKLKIINL